jgi:outer membrane protein OmpA-like peptidoglycan-associated protein
MNSTSISRDDKSVLNNIRQILSSDKNIFVEIGGHADKGTGTDFVNDNISLLRAQTVYNYFKDNGMDMTNITFKGYGSSIPIYNNIKDRRIEFKIIDNDKE